MKLIEGVSTQIKGEEAILPGMPSTAEYYAVFTGNAAEIFPEPIRLNEVTHFVLNELKEDKTEDELIASMVENYEVDEAVAREDISALIAQLKNAGIIEG